MLATFYSKVKVNVFPFGNAGVDCKRYKFILNLIPIIYPDQEKQDKQENNTRNKTNNQNET